jgi:leader peptidase (prepilin peptidase)/N-methyltransferase
MIEAFLALLFGLIIGSFLNVCIFRLPRDLSVVAPRSFCIECEKTIGWYDLIPVVSYLLLGGKCRYCGHRISWRYPLVEALTGALFFFAVWKFGLTLVALKLCVFGAILIALIFTDIEARILPDEFTLGGTILGLIFSWFVWLPPGLVSMFSSSRNLQWNSLGESALGAAFPTLCMFALGYLYLKIRKREGLGLGDVKMVAMIGSFQGLTQGVLSLMIGSVLGSVIGVIFLFAARKDMRTYELPFGTFLGVGALAVALLGLQ